MMDMLEINDQFAVILFEDKTGGAWCKKVTGAEARLILGMASALNEGELPAVPVEPVHIYGRSKDNEAYTDGKRVAITTWTHNYDDISFRRRTAEWFFSEGGYTMNIAQLARMKDEKLVDSYTTA